MAKMFVFSLSLSLFFFFYFSGPVNDILISITLVKYSLKPASLDYFGAFRCLTQKKKRKKLYVVHENDETITLRVKRKSAW